MGKNIYVIIQWFIYLGLGCVGLALHAASGHESTIILILAWVWVGIIYVMTMYRFHEDAEKKQHERSHLIVTLDYDLSSPFPHDFHEVIPDDLDEFDRQHAIENFCKDAIAEKLIQEMRKKIEAERANE